MKHKIKNATKYTFGHIIELHVSPEQKRLIRLNHLGMVDAYNMTIHYLDAYYQAYLDGLIEKPPTRGELSRFMTAERSIGKPKEEGDTAGYPYSYYSQFSSVVLHKAVDCCFNALDTFFKNIKAGKPTPGYPNFKRQIKRGDVSICVAYGSGANNVKLTQGGWAIKLPDKVGGEYRLKEQLRFDGVIREVHLKIKASRVYASIKVGTDQPPRHLPDGNQSFGFDLGSKKTTVYNGKHFYQWGRKREQMTRRHREHIAHEQTKLDRKRGPWNPTTRRKQRHSERWYKQFKKIEHLRSKYGCQLADLRHNSTTHLVKCTAPVSQDGFIVTQRDNLKSQHKRKKAKDGKNTRLIQTSLTASRMGWGIDLKQLEYKTQLYDRKLILIPSNKLTTGICPFCQHKHSKEDKHIKNMKINCKGCGREYNRNHSATVYMYRSYAKKMGYLS